MLLCNSFLTACSHCIARVKPIEQRLEAYLHYTLNQSYPELQSFFQGLLHISHRQATVERFLCEQGRRDCEAVEAQKLVFDHVSACGGVLKVTLTKELLASVASTLMKRQGAMRGLKRQALEDELEELNKKKEVLTVVCVSRQRAADQLAEQAVN